MIWFERTQEILAMRKIGLIGLFAVLCIGGAAFAQDAVPVFCGNLEQADCDLLTHSHAAMESLDSVLFGFTVNTTVSNIPDQDEPVTVTLMGDGAVTGLSTVRDSAAMAQTDPGAFLTSVLSDFDASLTLTLLVPPELAEDADMEMLNNLSLEVRLVDGVGYLNTDTLQSLINNPSIEGWYGLDLAGLIQGLLEQNPDIFAQMGGMQMMGMDMNSMALMQQFSDPEFLSRFATIEKVDIGMPDETTFRVTVNLGALMSSPEFQDLMRQQMQAQFEMQGMAMTDEEMQQAMAMSAQMFQNMTITIDETIGNTDFYVRSVHGTFNMDMAAMMAAVETETGSKGSASESAPNVGVDFTLFYNSYNMVPPITAPEDATVIPWQMLLGFTEPTITPTFPTATTAAPQPTEEATVEPTSEATAEPTEEATVEPTAEATAEPTSEATVEPTAEATAQS
jgi:hypothetical protein